MCCKNCGRLPIERMYVGLLYHRKRISRDVQGLLFAALDATPYECVYCKLRDKEEIVVEKDENKKEHEDKKEEEDENKKQTGLNEKSTFCCLL